MEPVVVLNSLEKVSETLVEKQTDFAGRPVTYSSELLFYFFSGGLLRKELKLDFMEHLFILLVITVFPRSIKN